MIKYNSAKSNIVSYQITSDTITILFKDGHMYLYSNVISGRQNVETMKKMANQGSGLSSFISKNKVKFVKL